MSPETLAFRLRRRFRKHLLLPLTERVVVPTRRWRNSGREYDPIFVAGTMGSGTTLMALSLAQRFRCAGVVTESGHQVAASSGLQVQHPSSFDTVVDYLDSLRPKAHWSPAEGRRALLELYRGQGSGPTASIVDKGPNTNLLRAGFLHECFPQSWFVLVFRDPAVNIEGFRRKWPLFSTEDLGASIAFYEQTYGAFLDAASGFKERVIGVSYETLVAGYEETLPAIAERIGLRPAETLRRLRTRPNVPGQGVRNVRRGKIKLVKDANERAYKALSESEIAQIEDRLLPLYKRLESATAIG